MCDFRVKPKNQNKSQSANPLLVQTAPSGEGSGSRFALCYTNNNRKILFTSIGSKGKNAIFLEVASPSRLMLLFGSNDNFPGKEEHLLERINLPQVCRHTRWTKLSHAFQV